ncbi:hypothetical protein SAMN04488042_102109 [Shimia aestuarii]|uniref:Uncharacterized protein n=1 Tax=Shimia aestuarii TaxID=254406 RepID=A0A1I4LJ06_9RHOB|nr:hypothetical protein SAMN04488042_102109 [Shimia aestuarii]
MVAPLRISGSTGIQLCVSQAEDAPDRKYTTTIYEKTKTGNPNNAFPIKCKSLVLRSLTPVSTTDANAAKGLATIRKSNAVVTAQLRLARPRCPR